MSQANNLAEICPQWDVGHLFGRRSWIKSPVAVDAVLGYGYGMPNKRARNKVFFGGFIERGVKARLTRAAAAAGMRENVFGFAMEAVERRLGRLDHSRSKRQLGGPAKKRAPRSRSRVARRA